jgi:inhibitor of the pro-sigma K processing machinery
MKVDPILVFSILGGLILILLFAGAPIRPLSWVGKLSIRIIIGALMLFLVNAFGTSLDIHIPINFITSSISGILGLPGLAAMIIIKTMIIG